MKKKYKIGLIAAFKVITTLGFGYYVYQKFQSGTFNINYVPVEPLFLFAAFLLTPLNWMVESYKWKLLSAKVEEISYFTAIKSTLSGLASSLVTPFRLGDPLGKILFLKEGNRVEGAMLSVMGSLTQLAATIIAGLIAVILYAQNELFAKYYNYGLIVTAVLIVVGIIAWFVIKQKYADKLKAALSVGIGLLAKVFALSVIRYILFIAQFIFVFSAYGEGQNPMQIAGLTAIYFFVVAVVPMFIVAEPGMRGAIALAVFVGYSQAFTSATMVWLLNVLLPAAVGLIFLLLQKNKAAQAPNTLPSQP